MFRIWMLVQILFLALLWCFPSILSELVRGTTQMLPDPHGTVKYLLEGYHGLLLRRMELPWMCAIIGLAGLAIKGKQWKLIALGVFFAGQILPHYSRGLLSCWLLWVLLNVAPCSLPYRLRSMLLCLPGAWLLLPRLLRLSGKWILGRFLLMMFTIPLWVIADGVFGYERLQPALEAWPESRLSHDITQLARSPVGVRSDWHGVRILDQHAVVACERIPRIVAFPLQGGPEKRFPLRPRNELEELYPPIDIAIDSAENTVWALDGGRDLLSLTFEDGDWTPPLRQRLPVQMQFATFNRRADELLVTSVQVSGPFPRTLLRVDISDPHNSAFTIVDLNDPEAKLPMPRESLWVPPLKQLLLAPDFGTHIYAANIDTGLASKWLEAPTMNGKMIWLPARQEIALALPNRFEMWFVDPENPKNVRKVPTQPGVRAVAIDEERNLMITASVLTGSLWVQDLESGRVLKRAGTVMPMIREMAIDSSLGVAVLTTWAAVYKFDYLAGTGI